jgi:hypothetical protein
MRFCIPRSIAQLAPALVLAASVVACQSSTAPIPTGVDALTTAKRDKSTLLVTSAGTPSASQTFPGGYLVDMALNSLNLSLTSNGTIGGDLSLSGAITLPGQAAMKIAPKMTFSCLVFEQRGSAVHVYGQGMVMDAPGAPPGVASPGYLYLVDDPNGDQMWSGPLGKLGDCAVPSTITNPDGTTGTVSLKPMQNGSITVTIK